MKNFKVFFYATIHHPFIFEFLAPPNVFLRIARNQWFYFNPFAIFNNDGIEISPKLAFNKERLYWGTLKFEASAFSSDLPPLNFARKIIWGLDFSQIPIIQSLRFKCSSYWSFTKKMSKIKKKTGKIIFLFQGSTNIWISK